MHLKCRFFFEGKTEKKFVTDIVSYYFNINLNDNNLQNLNGYSQDWIKLNQPAFEKAIKEGFTPVLLLDADNNFNQRSVEIGTQLALFNYNFQFFIFPNHSSNGTVEDLLLTLTNSTHSSILKCFDNYNSCISPPYNPSDKKAKLFAYLEALLPKNRIHETHLERRNYLDREIWNLESASIGPLINFLKHL